MISIIIPAYNSAATIVEALDSVAAQTLWDVRRETLDVKSENDSRPIPLTSHPSRLTFSPPLFEVIIVDDCSTDNTAEVVQNWITHHSSLFTLHASRITLHILPKNGGPALARNKGIEEAHGDWIAFLDADDIWLPHKLELQMRLAAEHPEVALWCGNCIGFADAETTDHRPKTLDLSEAQKSNVYGLGSKVSSQVLSPVTLETLALHNPIATSTVLVKREVLLAVGGFDTQFRGPEDYDLWLRVAAYGQREEKRIEQKEAKEKKERILDSAEGGKYNSSSLPLFPSVKQSSGGIVHVAEPVSRYRQVPGSLSLNDLTFLPQILRVLNKAYGKNGVLEGQYGYRKAAAYQYLCAAWSASERVDVWRAISNFAHSCFLRPWPLRITTNLRWGRVKILFCIFRMFWRKAKHL